jgi:hypothetical protein
VRWIEAARNWQAKFDAYGDPVSEEHALVSEEVTNNDVPLGQIVDEERPAWLEDPQAMGQPRLAPDDVFMVRKIVINLAPVILGKVEWWISKYSVDGGASDMREDVQAVSAEENTPLGHVALRWKNLRIADSARRPCA